MLSPPSHLRTVLRILAIWLLLAVLWPQDAIHPDSTHDLLMVRDCLELQRCDTAGPMSSWHGVHQGALWVNGLALARSLWTPLGTALFLTLLNAIAIVVTADWLHARSTHAQSTLPLLVATALGTTSVVLVMPTALWPLVLVSSCLFLQLLETPARSGFALLAVLLGFTVDVHAMAWPLVLAMAMLLWNRALRLPALLLIGVAWLTSLAISPRAWQLLAADVQTAPDRLLLVVTLPLLWLLLRAVRNWPPQRQLALVGLLVWGAIGVSHQFALRYLLPWSGMLVLSLAPFVPPTRVGEWLPRLLVAVLCIWRLPLTAETLTYRAAAQVATHADTAQLGWPEVLTELRGSQAPLLAESAAVYLSLQPATAATAKQVRVEDGQTTDSRLLLRQTEVCAGVCQPLRLAVGPLETPAPFVGRAMPFQLPLAAEFAPITLRIPVRAGSPTRVSLPPPPATRFLLRPPRALRAILQPGPAHEPCDWRFANGQVAMGLDGAAQTLTVHCAALQHPGDLPPRLLPSLVEDCAVAGNCGVAPSLRAERPRSPVTLPPLAMTRTSAQARLVALLSIALWIVAVWRLRRPPQTA